MRLALAIIVALLPGLAGAAGPESPANQQAPSAGPAQDTTFAVFLQGVPAGSERIAVAKREDGGWTITSSGRVLPPLDMSLRRAEVRYDAAWRPLGLTVEGLIGNRPVDVSTEVEGGTAHNSFLQAGQRFETTAPIGDEAVLLTNSVFGPYAALAVRLAGAATGDVVRAFVAPRGEIDVTVDGVGEERLQTAKRSFLVRRIRVTFANPQEPLAGEIWVEPDGKLARLTLGGALDVVREDVAVVSARQQTFVREGDEDVRIPATGFSLAATLSRPRVAEGQRPAARLPAIILVPGSGPIDRDAVVAGIPVFGQLASDLADAGFLVVRYDKRGIGQSGGRAESATLSDYAEDVRSIVRFLRRRKDVDNRRLFVVGHSEGAWIGLLAASREKHIARVALLAGAGTPGAELVLEQQRRVLDQLSISEAEKAERIDLQQRINAAVAGRGSWEGIPNGVRQQADTPWFQSFLTFEPAKAMLRVRQPILVVQGSLDTQVLTHHAEKLEAQARARKRNTGVEVVRLEGVNHLFVPAGTGEVAEYPTLETRRVTPQLAERVAAWLAGR
jgi:uncharacterized protein